MTIMTITQIAQELRVHRSTIYRYVSQNRIPGRRGPRPPNSPGNPAIPIWLVDLEDARRYLEAHPTRDYTYTPPSKPAPPAMSVPPAVDLSEIQHAALASERWHELRDIQPDPIEPGAVRTWWSDGESYVLLPGGEQTGYAYEQTDWEWKAAKRGQISSAGEDVGAVAPQRA